MGERKTGVDFLRVFATLQVILFHTCQFVGYGSPAKNHLMTHFSVISKTNNLHFMLISGYVGATSNFLFTKQFPVIFASIFYSFLNYFTALFIVKKTTFSYMGLFKACFPLANTCVWYTLPYLTTQILFAFINPTLKNAKLRYHLSVCAIFLWLHVTPFVGFYQHTCLQVQGSIGPFLVLGMCGSFFRFHYKGSNKLVIFYIALYIALYYYNFQVHQHPEYFKTEWKLLELFSQTWIMNLPSIMFAFPLFLISLSFTKQWKYHYLVQFAAECSLPIYMFHCYPEHYGVWLDPLKEKFKQENTIELLWWTMKIYISGFLVETTRHHLFNALIFKRFYYKVFTSYFNHIFMETPYNHLENQ